MSKPTKLRRYNLTVPEELFDEVQRIADERGTTVVELMRKFIKLGLLAVQVEGDPDAQLVIREGQREQRLLLI